MKYSHGQFKFNLHEPCLSLVHPQPLGLLPGRPASAGDLNERTTASSSLETLGSLVRQQQQQLRQQRPHIAVYW